MTWTAMAGRSALAFNYTQLSNDELAKDCSARKRQATPAARCRVSTPQALAAMLLAHFVGDAGSRQPHGWPSQWPRTQLAFSSLKRKAGATSVKELQIAIDTRHRGKTGEISRKHGNTLIRTLRKTYGSDFAKGCADDEKLSDILERIPVT